MLKVIILGTGNVAKHLFDAFLATKNVAITQVIGRNYKALKHYSLHTKTSTNYNNILEADVYIIAVSDPAIPIISEKLKNKKGIITHTAGSISLTTISEHHNYGVFYPLQTFTKEKKINFKHVPFCLEASDKKSLEILKILARTLSKKVYEISSVQREKLHIAAVFINNFSNYMYHIGYEICNENDIPFDVLKPLIKETSNKIETIAPIYAQTGPAKRNDTITIDKHINQIENINYKKVYALLSEQLLKLYGKEL